ncbi:MAG: helix-hairpin-helix domain-containing protein [Bacteroidales bacterium]|nr:helix-hairpin-helix domain-containing protein [Bacteroidales bacterium]
MEELRRFLSFNKGERIAIIVLMAIILVLVLAVALKPQRVPLNEAELHNLDSLLALHQAALDEQKGKDSLVLFPFNPNTMTEEEGRRLGLTESQIRNVLNYRDKGGKFRIQSDLGRLYTISEEDYLRLEPYIDLPKQRQETLTASSSKKGKTYADSYDDPRPAPREIPHVELNTVDSATLVELPQIGPYIAMRIIEYRERLGGYADLEQMREVKGVDSTRFDIITPYIETSDHEPRKIDVNRDDFRTLVRHPYLNYEQVKRIFNQREKRGMIKNWKQLEALIKEAGEVNPWLEYYVKY